MRRRSLAIPAFAAALAAAASLLCAPFAAAADPFPPALASALAAPERPAEDRQADARRQAASLLEWIAPQPGWSIFDIEAGGGYWTELMARAVGPQGRVTLHNPPAFAAMVAERVNARLAGGRLANVRPVASLFDALDAPDSSQDLVLWVQGPHELHFRPGGQAGDPPSLGDPERSFREIARILKPGACLVAIDHSARAGAPVTTGHDLHRVDPDWTIQAAARAGLRLVATSEVLANPGDDRSKSAFDPAIRGRTDQHALKLCKAG